jgi:flagellar basal-body rod protein FlgB
MKILGNIERLQQGLDYHLARHNLLSANLANVDTPNYRPRDLERLDGASFEGHLQVELTGTQPGHQATAVAGAPGGGGLRTRVVVDETAPADADGNSVSLDREAVKVSANHVRYESISTLVSGQLASILWAVTDGKGGG